MALRVNKLLFVCRKIGAIFLILVLTMVLLEGCAKQPNSESNKSNTADIKAVNITFWYPQAGNWLQIMNDLINQFQKEHPNIKITAMAIPEAQRMEKLLTALAGGEPPDVTLNAPSEVPVLAAKNAIVAIDSLGEVPKDYYDAPRQACIVDNHLYALPIAMGNMVLYYNAELFKKAGLDPEKPPTTWNELIDYARKLTNPSENQWGILLPTKVAPLTTEWWDNFLWASGGKFLSQDNKEAAFNSQEGVEALQFWVDLFQKYKVAPLIQLDNVTMVSMYQTGKVGMLPIYPQFVQTVRKLPFETKTAMMPKNIIQTSTLGGYALTISQKSKDRQAAWTFINWLSRPENAVKLNVGMGSLPVRKATYEFPSYQEFLKKEPLLKPFIATIPYTQPYPQVPNLTQLEMVVAEEIQKALYREATPKQALDNAAIKVNEILSKPY
ncbi:ABC transporter substrate-binding protein [Moorella naiadis]|uniref:ABC transporter substrate-binding protein n=1 Tax=Moorella naiadis (nom. illeg.) TaxID=3093670 RepID=UPI003D9CA018